MRTYIYFTNTLNAKMLLAEFIATDIEHIVIIGLPTHVALVVPKVLSGLQHTLRSGFKCLTHI